jgi:hypothetical protein
MSEMLITRSSKWVCPNCAIEHTPVPGARPQGVLHRCPGLLGIEAPLVESGVKVSVRAIEREDYIGDEKVVYDAAGRPIMAVISEREHGSDLVINAPLATGSITVS